MDPRQNPPQAQPLTPTAGSSKTGLGSGAQGSGADVSGGDLIKQVCHEANQASTQAAAEARNLMTGERADMHTAMLAVQKADLSFQLMMAVRSKPIDAYREVMRLQV